MKRGKQMRQGYVPMTFSAECDLTPSERETIESQRRSLWQHGVRTQPMLDRMAFEFAYVLCAQRATRETGGRDGL